MQLDVSYRQIWKLSAPIMLGSAAQNIIALSDAVLLYHRGETEFAAIGFAGVFYLLVAAIGYGFSRGGQIMIARRMGEGRARMVGHTFHAMLWFELALALVLWAFMRFGTEWMFSIFLNHSPEVYHDALEYIHYRSYGVFFGYAGVAMISLYTAIARPKIILYDTIVLALVNLALNYCLIFGKFGLPEMGIGGSGLASTIAEGIAFIVFVLYMIFDKENRKLRIFTFPSPDFTLIRQQLNLALPILANTALGQGSWIYFFGMVENYGPRALAISNLARTVYLMLSIPLWGFAAGVNTLISNLIGQKRNHDVWAAALKTGWFCWLVTMVIAIPVLLFPGKVLYPLIGKSDMSLVGETQPVFYLMLVILTLSAFGSVLINVISGTGASQTGLRIQFVTVLGYFAYLYFMVKIAHVGLVWAWTGEIVYWLIMTVLVLWYLRSERWHHVRV